MTPEWRVIPGTEGLYSASSCGLIARNRKKGKIIKTPTPDKDGYLMVCLSINKKKSTLRVHRLVAATFIGDPPPDRQEINHIDGVKTNNAVDNLEYASSSENYHHAVRSGLFVPPRGERNGASKFSRGTIDVVVKMLSDGQTRKQIASATGMSYGGVRAIQEGRTWGWYTGLGEIRWRVDTTWAVKQ